MYHAQIATGQTSLPNFTWLIKRPEGVSMRAGIKVACISQFALVISLFQIQLTSLPRCFYYEAILSPRCSGKSILKGR